MKNKSILLGLLALMLAGLFTTVTLSTKAQGNPNQRHEVVMIGSGPAYHRDEQGAYISDGQYVDWVDASPGAPVVERKTSLAAAIAGYMNLGFTHEVQAGYHLFKK